MGSSKINSEAATGVIRKEEHGRAPCVGVRLTGSLAKPVSGYSKDIIESHPPCLDFPSLPLSLQPFELSLNYVLTFFYCIFFPFGSMCLPRC